MVEGSETDGSENGFVETKWLLKNESWLCKGEKDSNFNVEESGAVVEEEKMEEIWFTGCEACSGVIMVELRLSSAVLGAEDDGKDEGGINFWSKGKMVNLFGCVILHKEIFSHIRCLLFS